MGQQNQLEQALLSRPTTISGNVQYPKPGDPGVVDDRAIRGLMVGLGLEQQAPGDAAGAIGATAGLGASMLPIGKLLKFFKRGNTGMPTLSKMSMPPEIHQMPTENPIANISRDEIDQLLHLSVPRPHLETPHPGPPPLQTPESIPQPPVGESNEAKIARMLQDRMKLRQEGRPTPRVPNKPEGM